MKICLGDMSKHKFPKIRRRWPDHSEGFFPRERVVESKKKYNRSRVKVDLKKELEEHEDCDYNEEGEDNYVEGHEESS